MLYVPSAVSTKMLRKTVATLMFILCGAGAAFAATPVPPQMIPFTVNLVAGNGQTTLGGYGGEGQQGIGAFLSSPSAIAVDSVGNVYFADSGNAIIREVNAQTGIITTVAGVDPGNCVGTSCSAITNGCADGVPAYRNPVGGSIQGMAIDAYGNLYFSDASTNTISVIYRGGSQVANFITLEDPSAVNTSGGVKPGYVYHVAGTITLAACAGSTTASATSAKAAVPAGDGALAFQSATFNNVEALGLDSAGNLYAQDVGNDVIRVINTQATTQTFFGQSVAPGFIKSIVNCNAALTQICANATASLTGGNVSGVNNGSSVGGDTGIGAPAAYAVFNTLEGHGMSVDAYGNIYEVNYKGATPGIYAGVAYAGGTALGKMISNAITGESTAPAGQTASIPTVAGLTPTPGDWYYLLQNITLRPSEIVADTVGNLYYLDNHYVQVYRVDANALPYYSDFLEFTSLFNGASATATSGTTRTGFTPTVANPAFCQYYSPTTSSTVTLTGYKTYDAFGDGCPVYNAKNAGYGALVTDGPGNVYIADMSDAAVRKIQFNNVFAATPLNTPLQQTIQVHFDPSNLPALQGVAGSYTTTSFAIAPGIPDFTISPVSSLYTTNVTPAVTGNPTCSNLTSTVDSSEDCVVNVIFTPTATGVRQSQLVVTTANGGVYYFGLTGIGSGGQLVVDGGAQTTVGTTGLGRATAVAITQAGTVYVADPTNNRIVVTPAGGTQTAIGPSLTGTLGSLKSPMGVAVDAQGNVYISDTGNNRIIEVAVTGVQSVLGGILTAGTPAYTPYAFNGPQGIAVDVNGNVYVADTGNKVVVEIPSNPVLGGATPLLKYANAPTFGNPVGVAVDKNGNVFVADTKAIQIYEIPAGGGDLQNLPGAALGAFGLFRSPNGVAVDGAGDLYVSDSTANLVYEVPSATGPGSEQFALNFIGLSSPSGVALDANGNVYVADTGNSRLLLQNRNSPTVQFGTVAQFQPAASPVCNTSPCTLTVTNIGNQPLTLASSFTQVTSNSPTGNTAFTLSNTCANSPTLLAGLHCTITTTFKPTSDGVQSEVVTLNGSTSQAITLTGTGEQPLVKIALAVTAPSGGPVAGQPATVTATVTQPNIGGDTPLGPIAFSYTNSCDGTGGSATVPLTAGTAAGSSTASFTLPALLEGRQYTINAIYTDDALNSPTVATPLVFYIPGIPVTVTANSVSYTYGQAVPAITGTVTGVSASDNVTYKFTTAATSSTPVGTYPITVVFSGGTNACNYGLPPAVTPTGTPAVVTENPAPLTVAATSATAQYGAANLSYTSVITGAVNGDQFGETYTPAASSTLAVGTYSIVPSLIGNTVGDYTIKVTNGSLTVTQASTAVSVGDAKTSVLASAVTTAPLSISVASLVPAGLGTPTGTVTLTDVFTPITPTAPGTAAALAPVTIGPLTLVAGAVTYTPTSTTLGTHSYTVSYSGDKNFQASTTAAATTLLVDNADFTVSSTTNPIQVLPGIIPGGNAAVSGEQAATPETATVTVTPVLGLTGTITLTCQPQNPSYVTCALTPSSVSLSSATAVTSVISISTPATLPLGFKFSELRKSSSKTVLAFLPLGVLAFCLRRRRKLSNALWMLLALVIMSAGMTGCGGNLVDFYTPVPQGAQTVTITASGTSPTTNTVITRSFTVTINIE